MSIEKQVLDLVHEANKDLSYKNMIGIPTELQLEDDKVKLKYLNIINVMTEGKLENKVNKLKENINGESKPTPEKPKRRARRKASE